MKKKNMFKYYKTIAILFYLIGITSIVVMKIGPKAWRHDFVSGFGTGLLIVALVLTVIYIFKRKDKDFEEDLNAAVCDERLVQQQLKMHATLSHVLIVSLVIAVTVSAFYEFTFVIGGTIILYIYILALIILKIKNKLGKR